VLCVTEGFVDCHPGGCGFVPVWPKMSYRNIIGWMFAGDIARKNLVGIKKIDKDIEKSFRIGMLHSFLKKREGPVKPSLFWSF
jgi:hypothetical protein